MVMLLRVFAIGCILAGATHVFLGLGADAALGAHVGAAASDATLDSQNRFYGASFTLYGVLTWLFTTDTARYAPMFRLVMLCFLASGMARIVSIILHGAPSPMVLGLLASELLLPPLFLWWTRTIRPAP